MTKVKRQSSPEMQRLLTATFDDPRVEDIAQGMYVAHCRGGTAFRSWDKLTHVIRQVYRRWADEIVRGMPSTQPMADSNPTPPGEPT